jgi:hypothetical protein
MELQKKDGNGARAQTGSLPPPPLEAQTVRAAFDRDGFVIVKGLFSLDEVLDLRDRCKRAIERLGHTAELLSTPELRDVMLDDRIHQVLRALLGPTLVYFGDSTFYANSRFDRHLHVDARADDADPSKTEYPIVRMGLYLQDHAQHSNGLKVRPGAHKTVLWSARNVLRLAGIGGARLSLAAFKPKPFYNVPSEPGDLVVWSLRMHHAGHAIRLRFFDELALPPALERFVPQRLQRPMPKDRYAIFCSWGKPSAELDAYLKSLGYHPDYRAYWQRSKFNTPEIVEACEKKGIVVRDDVLKLAKMA